MATISFPSNPTLYQTVTTGGQTWAWNGDAWVSAGSLSTYYYSLPEASATTLGGIRIGDGLAWLYSSPWTATISGITSTSGLLAGDVITATNGTGSLGSGGTYIVASVIDSNSITFTATGGTTPLAGTITSLMDGGTNLGNGTVGSITGTSGTLQVSNPTIIGATGAQGPSGGYTGSTGYQGATGLSGQNGGVGATGAGFSPLSSTTSLTISAASKTFAVSTLSTDTNFIVGLYVRLYNTTSNYMEGIITAYSNYTMTVNFDTAAGSGTYTSWTLVVTGSKGNIGATGASGLQGSSGATGASGYQGASGATGYIGGTGATGSGATGASGIQGLIGSTGYPGATGQGATGASGIQGSTGYQGSSGATGASGLQGATGAGATGASGATGPEGYQGATGLGIPGLTGATGVSGNITKTYYYGATLATQTGSLRFYLANAATLTKIVTILQTAGSSQSTIVVKQNGGTISTVNIPATTTIVTTTVSQSLAANDYLTVDITQAGTGAAYLYVTFIYG